MLNLMSGIQSITFTRAPGYSIIQVCTSRQQLIIGQRHLPSWLCLCGSITQIDITEAAKCGCTREVTDEELIRFIFAVRAAGGAVRVNLSTRKDLLHG
jgi:hypothetical protein